MAAPLSAGARAPRADLLPSVAVGVAGALWGLFWIPMRYLDAGGLDGAWATLALFAGSLVLVAPGALARRPRLRPAELITGTLTGGAVALYAVALVHTEVVVTMLLFYLSPVWSTLLERWLLGVAVTRTRAIALGLGLLGLWVILGRGAALPLPRNVGDWMALVSGVLWAYGSLRVHRDRHVTPFGQLVAFVAGGTLVMLALLALPVPGLAPGHPPAALPGEALAALAVVVVLLVATCQAILWGARLVSPGRVGLLMMGEVVVGILTAAAFSGEPFGPGEAIGAALIVAAAIVEVLPARGRARRP